jgi:hypothetical protein
MRLPTGLARLLNAAVIDATFARAFLDNPVRAATLAARDSGATFGCRLPDPALRLPALAFDESDVRVLARVPRCETLAEMARHLAVISTVSGARSTVAEAG